MKNIKLTIEYIGANYFGYQKQAKGKTVQTTLETAIAMVFGKEIKTTASGRTDAGVNAMGQVVNFEVDTTMPIDKVALAINAHLPGDIRVLTSEEVDKNFHSRYSAKAKTYIYKLYTGEKLSVFDKAYHMQCPKLDMEQLKKACKLLLGEHDFSSFMSSNSNIKDDTIRTIYDAHFEQNGDYLTFEITGNGFLYNMVRIIVGTLIDIGMGKKRLDVFDKLFEGNNRSFAGKTVKPNALFLKSVTY